MPTEKAAITASGDVRYSRNTSSRAEARGRGCGVEVSAGGSTAQMKLIAPMMKGMWPSTPVHDMANCPSVEAVMLMVE